MDVLTLVKSLDESFLIDELPLNEQLVSKNDRLRYIESQNIYNFFLGKKWPAINLKVLTSEYNGDGSACLSFMSDIAFRYYLPAYLKICLLDDGNADMIFDSTIWKLTPSDSHLTLIEFCNLFNPLSLNQKKLVTQVLYFLSIVYGEEYDENEGPQKAINEYWYKFLDKDELEFKNQRGQQLS